MRTKKSDCVEMRRRGAARIHRETKGMTLEQQIDYWRQRTEEFRKWHAQLRKRGGPHGN